MKINVEKLVENVIVGASFIASLAVTKKIFNAGKEYYLKSQDNNIDDLCEVIVEEAE